MPEIIPKSFTMMPQASRVESRSFASSKCRRPIVVSHPSLEVALIAATLDPDVTSIDMVETDGISGQSDPLIVLDRSDGRFALQVSTDAWPRADRELTKQQNLRVASLGLTSLDINGSDLELPRFLNAKQIWHSRNTRVSAAVRIQVSGLLAEGGRPLGDLLRHLRADVDPLRAIFAMACNGEIGIDLDGDLGPSSMVRDLA